MISAQARDVLRKSTFIHSGDVGVSVPPGVTLEPAVHAEIESLVRIIREPVNEAARAALAAILEIEGLQAPGAVSVVL
jgi:hypothetical protein